MGVVRFVASVLRIYSFVFHLTLSVFLLGLAGIAYHANQPLELGVLPFPLENALRDAAMIGSAGLLCSLLAVTRWFKFIFILWTALMLFLMTDSFFFGPYAVSGNQETHDAAWLTLGAVGAFLGAIWSIKYRRRRSFL